MLEPELFRLSTRAHVFQRLIDTVISGLPFVYSYLDYLLAFSKSEEKHLKHLTILFERVWPNINLKKCKFGRTEVNFLGHVITAEGVLPASDKIVAI